jgi:RluA family pseudouridine synthase
MNEKDFFPEVLFEDYYLLVVNKPAGLMVENDSYNHPSVEHWAKNYLQKQHPNSKKIFVGFPHRLDRPVSGAMIIVKKKAALIKLNEQFEKGSVQKKYVALVSSKPNPEQATLHQYLKKDLKNKRAVISEKKKDGYVKCSLSYKLLGVHGKKQFALEIELHTGRFHQIRAQLSHIGCLVVGDEKYGSEKKVAENMICLHAEELLFTHPVSGEVIHVISKAAF